MFNVVCCFQLRLNSMFIKCVANVEKCVNKTKNKTEKQIQTLHFGIRIGIEIGIGVTRLSLFTVNRWINKNEHE